MVSSLGLLMLGIRALSLPDTVIWAWERPEDVSFVESRAVGVAALAATIRLREGDAIAEVPRLQPLVVRDDTSVMPVVRIESPPHGGPSLSTEQRVALVSAIDAVVPLASAHTLQIDFDAKLSERSFYRSLLSDLRRAMPARAFLSITALASWCLEDRWLTGAPVDEAVPMLFRMGDASEDIRRRLNAGEDFAEPLCRTSAGVSTDEPVPSLPKGRRYYVFHPASWQAAPFEEILGIVEASRR